VTIRRGVQPNGQEIEIKKQTADPKHHRSLAAEFAELATAGDQYRRNVLDRVPHVCIVDGSIRSGMLSGKRVRRGSDKPMGLDVRTPDGVLGFPRVRGDCSHCFHQTYGQTLAVRMDSFPCRCCLQCVPHDGFSHDSSRDVSVLPDFTNFDDRISGTDDLSTSGRSQKFFMAAMVNPKDTCCCDLRLNSSSVPGRRAASAGLSTPSAAD